MVCGLGRAARRSTCSPSPCAGRRWSRCPCSVTLSVPVSILRQRARAAGLRRHRAAVPAAAGQRAPRQASVPGAGRRGGHRGHASTSLAGLGRGGGGGPGRAPRSCRSADLLNRDHGGVGDGTGAGGQFQLTTVNPFIRLRRDLVEQTHTPLVYAETDAPRRPATCARPCSTSSRSDEWRPSPRDLPSDNDADGPFPNRARVCGRASAAPTDDWKLQLAPELRHHLAAAALPGPRA